jgi:transcriptional regulator with PAS, ATPase and Fis domain
MPETPSPKKGRPRGSGSFPWRAFFQQSTTPVFVLGKGRRLRFANPAWEKLTGVKLADALGMVCSARRTSTPLAAALAPTAEAQAGKPDRARRAAPGSRAGTQWWDIAFAPLAGDDGPVGIVGFVTVVGESTPHAARKLPASVAALREKHAACFSLDLFAGTSPAGERFLAQLRHAAQSAAPVWLAGEPGSGKETAARVVHHAGAARDRAFVGVDCAGLQPYLVESLLFAHGGLIGSGHVGTLYLKDPAALPRDLQQKLADLFAETQNAPRLICGSARTAQEEVTAGRLVPEFHTALSVLELRVPPLRDRLDDLPRFAAHFLPGVAVEPAAFDVLDLQPWPGNLRELADALGAAAATAGKGPVEREHLPYELRARAGVEPPPVPPKPLTLDPLLEAVEKRLILLALRRVNNHQTEACELLGIFRARLWRRLEALGIPVPPQPPKPRPGRKGEKDQAE